MSGYRFTAQRRAEMQRLLLEDKQLPEFSEQIEKVSYLDGCKVYFCGRGLDHCAFFRHRAAAADLL